MDAPRSNPRQRRRCRRQRLAAAAAAFTVLVMLVAAQVACVGVITPPDPATLREPATVYLIDYHRHSALLLPRYESADPAAAPIAFREYTYGELGWFALNRTGWHRYPGVLFIPSQGVLGRADHPPPAGADDLHARAGYDEVFELRVERDYAQTLLRDLDALFESRLDTLIRNDRYGLDFVHHPDRYSIANHCNHAAARWLAALNVRMSPVPAIARFRLRGPPGR